MKEQVEAQGMKLHEALWHAVEYARAPLSVGNPGHPEKSEVWRVYADREADEWSAVVFLGGDDGMIGAYLVAVCDANRATMDGQVLASVVVNLLTARTQGLPMYGNLELSASTLDALTNAVRLDMSGKGRLPCVRLWPPDGVAKP